MSRNYLSDIGFSGIEGSNIKFIARLEQTNLEELAEGDSNVVFHVWLDAMVEDDLTLMESLNNFNQVSRIRSAIVELEVNRSEFTDLFGQSLNNELYEQWYRFNLNETGRYSTLRYSSLLDTSPIRGGLDSLERMPPSGGLAAITHLFSKLVKTRTKDIEENFQSSIDLLSKLKPGKVDVIDVGQGNMNIIHNEDDDSLIAYDFGGGVLQNSKTWPKKPQLPDVYKVKLIILSHWDFDHWGAIKRLSEDEFDHLTQNVNWIAPYQEMGINHLKFALYINRFSRLHIVASYDYSVKKGLSLKKLNLLKSLGVIPCKGKEADRNNSGFAMSLISNEKKILLPADAGYDFIDSDIEFSSYAGLVASHHGGDSTGIPPKAEIPAVVAYSFGHGNGYEHPYTWCIAKNVESGWKFHPTTAKRGKGLGRGNISLKFI